MDCFRQDLDPFIATRGSAVRSSVVSAAVGVLAGLLIAGAFAKLLPSREYAQVHCGDELPEADGMRESSGTAACGNLITRGIGRSLIATAAGSHGEATKGAHAFVMDARFLGEYKVPTDEHHSMWTCKSSETDTEELTCKNRRSRADRLRSVLATATDRGWHENKQLRSTCRPLRQRTENRESGAGVRGGRF